MSDIRIYIFGESTNRCTLRMILTTSSFKMFSYWFCWNEYYLKSKCVLFFFPSPENLVLFWIMFENSPYIHIKNMLWYPCKIQCWSWWFYIRCWGRTRDIGPSLLIQKMIWNACQCFAVLNIRQDQIQMSSSSSKCIGNTECYIVIPFHYLVKA